MNKTQREYAIRRATNMLVAKFPTPDFGGGLDSEYVLSVLDMEYDGSHHARYCASYLKEKHPAFEEYRCDLEHHNDIVREIKADRDAKIREVTDFIMLGNETEVLEYLKNLE